MFQVLKFDGSKLDVHFRFVKIPRWLETTFRVRQMCNWVFVAVMSTKTCAQITVTEIFEGIRTVPVP